VTTDGAGQPRLRVLRRGPSPLPGGARTPVQEAQPAPRVGLIAHAGLAAHRVGGAPNRSTLQRALGLGVAAVELDLLVTRDDRLVLHHDLRLTSGEALRDLTLRELRVSVPGILTLEEALDLLEGVPVVLDLKSAAVAGALCGWLRWNRRRRELVVCTERVGLLAHIHDEHPDVALWRTFPDVGMRRREHLSRVVAGLLAHRGASALRVAGDLWAAASLVPRGPRDAVAHISGLPWRNLLPELLESVQQECGARGVTVHHPIITAELCQVAHALGLQVIAWTVNDPAIAVRAAACGIGCITTDRVQEIREAIAPD
jgi:glycerophosphoryl diester phosphodiesterase